MDTVKNIFISHYGGDEKYIEQFKSKIGSRFQIRDSSVVETNPNNATNENYIKYNILKPKIDWAGTVVVLIGKETKNRDYVNWEIEYAIRNDKTVIGVYLPGATEKDLPSGVQQYGDSLVSWDSSQLDAALLGQTVWETPSGGRRPDVPTREVC